MDERIYLIAIAVLLIINIIIYFRLKGNRTEIEELERGLREEFSIIRMELSGVIRQSIDSQNKLLHSEAMQTEQKLETIRFAVESKLAQIQNDNNQKLDSMRDIVGQKLEKTLESRISDSFKLVNDRLEQVHRGLGEMQNLAVGVGDLKKILSNVKSRGVLGEIQLENILSDILTNEQYESNIVTKRGSKNFVEFAIKLPADDKVVYLPIDSKFPADAYITLVNAYEEANQESIKRARVEFANRIKSFAKDIADKYIDVPNTTEFAIMFLPFESMFGEAIQLGVFEDVQRKYKITIAGPTTMATLLNSLNMGFKTLAVQKRSSEVWEILGAVKSEFDTFESVLAQTQKKLDLASNELDKLIGVRTRQIQKKLKDVEFVKQDGLE